MNLDFKQHKNPQFAGSVSQVHNLMFQTIIHYVFVLPLEMTFCMICAGLPVVQNLIILFGVLNFDMDSQT